MFIAMAMDIDELAHALENAFTHAYPGREAAERDAMLREIWRSVRAETPAKREPRVPFAYPTPRSTHAPCSGALTDLGFSLQKSTSCLEMAFAVVSSMIDPFIVFPFCGALREVGCSHLFASGLSDSTRLDRASGSRALPRYWC
jgi:hypothetical protein